MMSRSWRIPDSRARTASMADSMGIDFKASMAFAWMNRTDLRCRWLMASRLSTFFCVVASRAFRSMSSIRPCHPSLTAFFVTAFFVTSNRLATAW